MSPTLWTRTRTSRTFPPGAQTSYARVGYCIALQLSQIGTGHVRGGSRAVMRTRIARTHGRDELVGGEPILALAHRWLDDGYRPARNVEGPPGLPGRPFCSRSSLISCGKDLRGYPSPAARSRWGRQRDASSFRSTGTAASHGARARASATCANRDMCGESSWENHVRSGRR